MMNSHPFGLPHFPVSLCLNLYLLFLHLRFLFVFTQLLTVASTQICYPPPLPSEIYMFV